MAVRGTWVGDEGPGLRAVVPRPVVLRIVTASVYQVLGNILDF